MCMQAAGFMSYFLSSAMPFCTHALAAAAALSNSSLDMFL